MTNWTYAVSGWLFLAAMVAALGIYRRLVARGEDDSLHVNENELPLVGRQVALAHRLDAIDHWGKIFTALVAVLGLALLAVYVYEGWQAGKVINY